MQELTYFINNNKYVLSVEGEPYIGENKILLLEDDDLTKNTDWHKAGYIVANINPEKYYTNLVREISDLIRKTIETFLDIKIEKFILENYHKYIVSDEQHVMIIHHLQAYSSIDYFPMSYHVLNEIVSQLANKKVSCYVPQNIASGRFFLRIVRPNKHDYNPPHKDVWLDHLRHALNIYLPIVGANDNSNLPIIPESHLWPENFITRTKFGSKINNIDYRVSSLLSGNNQLLMIRPEIKLGQFLLFSPYLVHGGAINTNEDQTRISLEMRFWRNE